jgi:hypothetical protein
MEPLSRTLQTNVGINTLEEDVYFYGYSPSQASLQYATSYQRDDNYHDNHYPTTSSRQPAWRASLYKEILYLREQIKLLEKRLLELQLSQRRTREHDQPCYSSPGNTSKLNRLTPCYMPVTHPQYRSHYVYSRNCQQESEDNYIDPETYQPRQSPCHTEHLYPDKDSIPHHSRTAAVTIKDSCTENPDDINPRRFITEEQFHQFTSEFIQSLMKDEYTWVGDNYQDENITRNKDFQQKTECYSSCQEDCCLPSRSQTYLELENKVIDDNQPKKPLNFKGLILQAKSQSIL